MNKSIKLLLPVVALALDAHASTRVAIPADAPRVIVKYDAAALVGRAAVEKLHGRLFMAAETVCHELQSRQLGLREQYERCVRDAVTRSVADIGNDNLTHFHRDGTLARQLAAN